MVGIGVLAGCTGNGGDERGGPTLDGVAFPAIDEWLTETQIGPAAPNYHGSVLDRRQRETVTVRVGVGDTGTRFGPPAIVVTAGTAVRWAWTGQGGAHTVDAQPDRQLGESDYEFSSGGAVASDSTVFERTLDRPGVALYHCVPHLSVGMKGGVAVE